MKDAGGPGGNEKEARRKGNLYSGRGRKRWKETSSSGNGKFELQEFLDLGVELSTKYRGNFMNMEKEKHVENALTRKEDLSLL